MYIDLFKVTEMSGTSENAIISQDNWKVVVCKVTGKKLSNFTVTKSDMVEHTYEHLNKLKACNIPFHTYDFTLQVRTTSL